MPINMLNEIVHTPVVGKIKLGEKRLTSQGKEYPVTVQYFNTKMLEPSDQEAIMKAYGSLEPTELDIMFTQDSLLDIVPNSLKWYAGGTKNAKGEVIGGRLKCIGDGPHADGTPGMATYHDKKDPVTGIAPMRPCMGRACPDYFDSNGKQQCFEMMQVFCMLPLVSWRGVFEITTKSKISMRSFIAQLTWDHQWNGGKIKGRPYKIVREAMTIPFTDPRTGQQKTGTQYIMKLLPNDSFYLARGKAVAEKLKATFESTTFLLPSHQELLERPAGSAFALEGDVDNDDVVEVEEQTPQITAEQVLQDPEIIAAFAELEKAMGRKFDYKARLIAVRKKESSQDVKGAVLAEIWAKIPDTPREAPPSPEEPVSPHMPTEAEQEIPEKYSPHPLYEMEQSPIPEPASEPTTNDGIM